LFTTVAELDTLKDFEVVWIDSNSQSPKNMEISLIEIYHYEEKKKPQITSPIQEPYIFTETVNDQVNIGSIDLNTSSYIDVHFELELNLINTSLEDLECPPNNFVVPGTNQKVAIVNGFKKYALSACELATLVNLNASGYVASAKDGFLVLTGDFLGENASLQVGDATWNQAIGLVEGDIYRGSDSRKVIDVLETEMKHVALGTYIYLGVPIKNPTFIEGERYFVKYTAKDTISEVFEYKTENFTVLKTQKKNLNYSFLK
jgi:hypothetical protein